MPKRDEAVETAIGLVESYCAQRTADAIRIEYETRGRTVTLVERRPPWNPSGGEAEWSRQPVAQLRFAEGTWTLFWPRHTGRWERYDHGPTADVRLLLGLIGADVDGVFWG